MTTTDQSTLRELMAQMGFTPVYDLEQAEPDVDQVAGVMPRPCGDCAYRKNSRERTGQGPVAHDEAFLDDIVVKGQPFWCHDGMRQPIAWRDSRGTVITREQIAEGTSLDVEADVDYQPLIIDGIPFRADGRPADLCAGWTARRLKHMQRGAGAS